MKNKLIIAIDGPAGSGKSTTAKLLAHKMGYLYIDTGAMYRAITYLAMKKNIVDDSNAVFELLKSIEITLDFREGVTHTFIDGEEVTEFIRLPQVNEYVSHVSKIDEVRADLVERQRIMGNLGGIVMEGRDIGTYVFPKADLKVYLIASLATRGERRLKEFEAKGTVISLEKIKANLEERDRIDSTRLFAPLSKAKDAYELDTSDISIDEQVGLIYQKAQEILELER